MNEKKKKAQIDPDICEKISHTFVTLNEVKANETDIKM